ncbi:MAG: M43 family zinc metalloprotease, partial [Bacteroidota bacterium]
MRCFATSLRAMWLLLTLLSFQDLFAQRQTTHHPGCSFDHKHEKLLEKFPDLRQEFEHYRSRVLPIIQQNSASSRSNNTIYVPIVVHIIHNGESPGSGANLSTAQIQAQIDVLNEDFSATNESYNTTPDRWKSVIGNPNIQFCLANIDPNGNPSNGITRNNITVTGTDSDDTNIESEIKPAIAWDPNKYYNIYVLGIPGTTAGGGVTGYAYLPYAGSIGNRSIDGSVVDYRWFGGPGFSQSGFKTLTHETGHYLGLFHTFNGRSCGDDDGIADTPNIGDATSASGWFGCNSGFPAGPESCGNEHMYVNYMDYASSSCYTSFTQGQNNVMRAVLDGTAAAIGFGSRANLAGNAVTACAFQSNDAAITAINNPGSQLCGSNTVIPQVVLTNMGSSDLTSAVLNYQVDGGAPVAMNWSGSLVSGGSATVDLQSFTSPNGSFSFQVYTSNPNGVLDEQLTNDTMDVQVSSVTFGSLPLSEDFEMAAFNPTTSGVAVFNPDNDNYAWERTNAFSASGGSASVMIDNFDANNDIAGTLDAIITPTYDFSSVVGGQLTFDYAYARYSDGSQVFSDSLLIIVSTNCGSLFDKVIYRNGAEGLETGTATPQAYSPTASEWRTQTVDLSAYNNVPNLTIALVNKSGWGNRLFLDNIAVTSSSVDCSTYSLTTNHTDVRCPNGSDGTASADPVNGVGPFVISWSTGSNQSALSRLSPGSYGVTITDSRSCSSEETVVISEPAPINITLTPTNATNALTSDGAITSSVVGGTAGYSYLWSNGATTAAISGLLPGNYDLTVTDANNCISVAMVEVEANSADCNGFSLDVIQQNVSCFDGSDGAATVVPQGGSIPYSISWSTGSTQVTASNLKADTYSVTVTDALGCSQTRQVDITQPNQLTASTSKTDESVLGAGDGQASATPSGGTSPYTYLWSNGATTQNISDLVPAAYTVTITDANDCSATATANIAAGPVDCSGLSLQFSSSDLNCHEDQSGSVGVDPAGGTAPYTYAWSTGATSGSIGNLAAGNYSVTVTDSNGCTQSGNRTIDQPDPLSVGISKIDETLEGKNDGRATASTSGGTPPYAYNWSNNTNTSQQSMLTPGVYTLTVSDANNCTATAEVEIEAGPVDCSNFGVLLSGTDLKCHQDRSGAVSVDPQGGVGPYTYSWADGSTASSRGNLAAGEYILTLTDSRGCEAMDSYELSQPEDLMVSIDGTDDDMENGDNGSAVADVSGGTTPYTYRWSNGMTTKNLQALAPGTYYVTITDANGCRTIGNVVIETVIVTCDNFELSVSKENPLCFGSADGILSVNPSGGQLPYAFSWSNGAIISDLTGLIAGTYSVTVTDANDCTQTTSVELIHPPAMTLSVDGVDGLCGKKASVGTTVGGGVAPYSYIWSNDRIESEILNLDAGNYSVTVSDANQCTLTGSADVILDNSGLETESEMVDASCKGANDGSIEITVTQGTAPFVFSWNTGDTSSMIESLAPGNYSLSLSDVNGCTFFSVYQIGEPTGLDLTFSTAEPQP